jgi:hypothetical protein
MVIKDLVNYREWVKTIKKEVVNPRSLYHKFGMKHNYFYTVYFPLTLPNEDQALPDNIKRMRVVESLAPVHRYIDEDLQFAEYIVPEFNQFYDEENQPTLTYGIVYRFAFKRLSIGWAVGRPLITGFLIWAFIHWPIISTIVAQIQEWIHLI